MFRDFGRDLRFAVRSLTGGPGFSLGVIGSLVLGIVANITAFSFVNAAVFRPFPGVRNQHELVAVGVARAERFGSVISSSYEEYQTLRASLPALDDLAAQLRVQLVVTHRGESSAVNGALVSAGWFDVLGVRPAAGRFFLTDESHTSVPVAVIGHDLWRLLFSEDPAAVGQMRHGQRSVRADRGRGTAAVLWNPQRQLHHGRLAAVRAVSPRAARFEPPSRCSGRRGIRPADVCRPEAAAYNVGAGGGAGCHRYAADQRVAGGGRAGNGACGRAGCG